MLAGCFTASEHILLVCKAHEKPVCQGGLIVCLSFHMLSSSASTTGFSRPCSENRGYGVSLLLVFMASASWDTGRACKHRSDMAVGQQCDVSRSCEQHACAGPYLCC